MSGHIAVARRTQATSPNQVANERSYFFFFDLHVAEGHIPPGV